MTIEQTVEIPSDHRLVIEVPPEIPAGKVRLEVNVIPFVKNEEKPVAAKPQKLFTSRKELEEFLKNAETPHTDALAGIVAHLGDITVEQIRDERLARHLP
jgi:hypothetical protein